uniref:Saposin B-type domain-containing protein n=1 Tax=Strix occidentalis caurina TaxID=311401 RepID=A0A8D0FZK1_STROC
MPVPLPLCWLCRTFLTRAEAAVPKEKVAAAAAGLCRVLPAVVAGACQCLAQRYAVLALEGALGRLGPRLLCHLLLACRPEDGDAPLSPPQRPLGDTEAPCGGTEVSRVRGWHYRVRLRWGGGVSRSPGMCQGTQECHSPEGRAPGCHSPEGTLR